MLCVCVGEGLTWGEGRGEERAGWIKVWNGCVKVVLKTVY